MSIFMDDIFEDITIWYRKNKKGQFEHNHFSYGHMKLSTPPPKHINQEKAWKSGEWSSQEALIKNNYYITEFTSV